MPEDRCDCRIIHAERISRAQELALKETELRRLTHICKALADPTRARILWALRTEEMCVCDLAALLGITESAVSHQLRLLRTHGLVTNRRAGPILYYRLADARVAQIMEMALTDALAQHNS